MNETALRDRLVASAIQEGDLRLLPLAAEKALADEFGLPRRDVQIAAVESRILPARYQRSLGTVGWDGQLALLRATVGIVGLGGLGGWIVEGLARMGVGRLILIDGDRFAENNLNRQALCWESTLGLSKADVAADRVRQLNPAVETVAHAVWADAESLPRLLAGSHVIVDALDTLPTRFLLQRVAQSLGVPMVHGAIAGYIGQVMTIFPGDTGLFALYPEGKSPERGAEALWGNPAATPMMIASWQIQEVIKLITGRGQPLRNRMLLMDAEQGSVEILRLGDA
ncbi:MAG: HesA/MoeB/ThiF family protein [Anaerolineales bacterium]